MNQDPFGLACFEYYNGNKTAKIKVISDLVEDDYIPVKHLFRNYDEMPDVEQKALDLCNGYILDVGAGAGAHALYLQSKGESVVAVDSSELACEVMEKRGVENVIQTDFFDWQTNMQFDTILMMMNGIGLVGELERLPVFLKKIKELLKPNGAVIVDSSDICYLFEDEDTEELPEMMDNYYGEVEYQMLYKQAKTDRFKWLFIDSKMLTFFANENGFNCNIIYEGEHYEYLAELKVADK